LTKKFPRLEEKIDVQTNNPRKLFRAISDMFEDEMSNRKYHYTPKEKGVDSLRLPELKGTGIEGVAEFDGHIVMEKIQSSHPIGRIIAGIIMIIFGLAFYFFVDLWVPFSGIPDFTWLVSLVAIIVGIVLLVLKSKTEMVIGIEITGESYRYKGQKQTTTQDIEAKERLDVVSDVRLMLYGYISNRSYYKEKHKEDLRQDLKYIGEKLYKIVPEYRIPDQND